VTSTQRQAAEFYLIREAQETKFNEEFDAVHDNLNVEQSPNVANSRSAINENWLLYMNSRRDHHLAYADLFINPIILPKEFKITEKIVIEIHSKHVHNGPEITLRYVKFKYWLLGGKKEIGRCLKTCENKLCKYPKPKEVIQNEANLPEARSEIECFTHISLDRCGPFEIKRCRICRNEMKYLKGEKDLDIDKTKLKECPTQKVYV